ncbi:hypothetical protein R1sor_023572 [Riccia sorocarpa]|uniref:Potassium transporter n=1 Tax=Riccia sorocarpa TaxID=122646 RepID=A0ABD3GPK0_9MARC
MGDTENGVANGEATNPSNHEKDCSSPPDAQATDVTKGVSKANTTTAKQQGKSRQRGHSRRSGLRRLDSLEMEAGRVQGFDPNCHNNDLSWPATLMLAYQSIGVVYGDLGTSPLYVFQSTFPDHTPSQNDILGALSLVIYTFTLIPLIKYILIVLQANDNGNGGTFALYSLIARFANLNVATNQAPEDSEVSSYQLRSPSSRLKRSQYLKQAFRKNPWMKNAVLTMAILGTAMVIGDGVLTPSISVLSAVEGLKVNQPELSQNVIVIITIVILIGLFSIQKHGTDKVGNVFSPVVLIWLLSIASIGIYNIVTMGSPVYQAFNPYYALDYLLRNKKQGWISLGGIALCVTGTEAMFADLGHFSVKAIQIAFTTLVFPCLLLAYIGQAAYLLQYPEDVHAAFYNSIPETVYWPVFVIATFAAIIASQAMISATFSIVSQAMTLGCFPRMKVIHTSEKYAGQIYIPDLNRLMMVLCVIIAAGFRDTTQIGNAYGVAVVSVFSVTTNLVFLIAIMIWQVPLLIALITYVLVSVVELLYLSSVMYKVPHGGWVPLLFVIVFFAIMFTWNYGRRAKYDYEVKNNVSLDWVLGLESNLGIQRFPGIGLVYTELAQGVPNIFPHLISNFPSLHSIVVFVCLKNLPLPHVHDEDRFLIRRVGPKELRMFRCAVRFGYLDVAERRPQRFEQQLMQNLANFVMMEGNINAVEDHTDQGTTEIEAVVKHMNPAEDLEGSARVTRIMRSARQISRDAEQEEEGYGSSTELESETVKAIFKPAEIADAALEEELAFMDSARHAGVVYLLGQSEIKARKSSSRFRRFMINHFYHALKRNCRSSVLWLNIPTERLLQVGMIHYI